MLEAAEESVGESMMVTNVELAREVDEKRKRENDQSGRRWEW